MTDVFNPEIKQEDLTSQIDGTDKNYITTEPFLTDTLRVYINGLKQRLTSDVEIISLNQFRLLTTPVTTADNLEVIYKPLC